jgi:hypothetical protein
MSRPSASLQAQVRARSDRRCEYCNSPEEQAVPHFEVEHVIPVKHGGATTLENLALACFYCNRYKGPNVGGISQADGSVVRLFHPRKDHWSTHFEWNGAEILGRTEIGRVTVAVLRMNSPSSLAIRRVLMEGGLWAD